MLLFAAATTAPQLVFALEETKGDERLGKVPSVRERMEEYCKNLASTSAPR